MEMFKDVKKSWKIKIYHISGILVQHKDAHATDPLSAYGGGGGREVGY